MPRRSVEAEQSYQKKKDSCGDDAGDRWKTGHDAEALHERTDRDQNHGHHLKQSDHQHIQSRPAIYRNIRPQLATQFLLNSDQLSGPFFFFPSTIQKAALRGRKL